jgi:hypothetical protein
VISFLEPGSLVELIDCLELRARWTCFGMRSRCIGAVAAGQVGCQFISRCRKCSVEYNVPQKVRLTIQSWLVIPTIPIIKKTHDNVDNCTSTVSDQHRSQSVCTCQPRTPNCMSEGLLTNSRVLLIFSQPFSFDPAARFPPLAEVEGQECTRQREGLFHVRGENQNRLKAITLIWTVYCLELPVPSPPCIPTPCRESDG